MRLSIIGLIFTFLIFSCTGEKAREKPNQSKQSKPLRESTDSPISNKSATDVKPPYQITFDEEQRFGTTDSIVVGDIATFAVDKKNRLFIADEDQTTVHVFNPNGGYVTSLGGQGKGPGEFSYISFNTQVIIFSDNLYVTDTANFFPHRAQVFSLNDFSFSHTMKLIAVNKNAYGEQLQGYYPFQIYPRDGGKFLVSYRRTPINYQDSTSYVRYFIQDSTASITRGPILEQKDRTNLIYLVEEARVPYLAIESFPFFSKSLLVVSENDEIYTATSKKFEINIHTPAGEYVRSFNHPFSNKSFSKSAIIDYFNKINYKSKLGDGVVENMIKEADNLPETWPALETMFFDDKNRLWISTIIDDNKAYEWWVLKKTGEVITKFEWPRDEPIRTVKNDYMYTLETEKETDIQRIIRYKVEIN